MKKIIVSSSLVLAFSSFILFATPDVQSAAVIVPETVAKNITPKAIVAATTTVRVPATIAKSATIPVAPATPTPAPTPTPTPAPVPQPVAVKPEPVKRAGIYNDGTYVGSVEGALYGNVQAQAVIQNGAIADIVFLQYPNAPGNSRALNNQAMGILKQEAIAAQSANVNIVSGATDTSVAFQQSLAVALAQAKA